MILEIFTDFSASARNAAEYAAGLSNHLPVEKVILYHSIDTLTMVSEVPLPSGAERAMLYEDSQSKLEELSNYLQNSLRETVQIEMVLDERPLDLVVQKLAEERTPTLAILGGSNKSKLDKALFGSKASSLLSSTCAVPVLIVPENARYQPIKVAALTSDLHKVANTPVAKIKEIVEYLNCRLLILNVSKEDQSDEPDQIMAEQAALHTFFDGQKAEFYYVDSKEVTEGILKFISDHDVQLVISVPKKRSFFDSIFHRSITKALAAKSTVPLLVLPPQSMN